MGKLSVPIVTFPLPICLFVTKQILHHYSGNLATGLPPEKVDFCNQGLQNR